MAPGAESATRLGGLVVEVKRLWLRRGVKAAVRIGVWVQSWQGWLEERGEK